LDKKTGADGNITPVFSASKIAADSTNQAQRRLSSEANWLADQECFFCHDFDNFTLYTDFFMKS
jgi:hypothetical protein